MELNILKRNMILCMILLSLLTVTAAAQEPEIDGYEADKPLSTYSHDSIKGGLVYTIGDSYYSGKVWNGDTFTVHSSVSLPEGAVVKFARLYSYWTWSAEIATGRYPDMKCTLDGVELEPDKQYSDRKGWGIYDYPTGTWSYDVTDYVTQSGSYTVVIENIGPEDTYFCMDGVGLLVVYTDEQGKYIEYWINEGCDMLNSQVEDNGTPAFSTPDKTITEMMNPTISQAPVKNATLWTIVQSGGWDENRLWVNDMNWSGVSDATPYPDLDIDIRDIAEHLTVGKNTIRFQAFGDYVVPSGSFLVVEIEPTAEGALPSISSGQSAEEASAPNSIPGFEAVPAIALILMISLLHDFRRFQFHCQPKCHKNNSHLKLN